MSNSDKKKDRPKNGPKEQPASLPKVLRIGIVQGGHIVEERIVRKHETVTVGRSEKNNFVMASQDLPARFEMFEARQDGGYSLNFTEEMAGRIFLEGGVKDLSEIRAGGLAKKRDNAYQIPLAEQSRGKISIGDLAVLFQFVPLPPLQPRPQLPTAARGRVFRDIDWAITIVWVVSFAMHASFIGYLLTADWPVVSNWDKYLELQKQIYPNEVTMKEEKAEEKGEGEGKQEAAEEEKQPEKKASRAKEPAEQEGPKKSADDIARERAERRAMLAEQMAQRGINKILGTLGGDGEGVVADVLRGGDVGADQDALLSQISGVSGRTGDSGVLRGPAGGKGSGEAADISQLKIKGGDSTVMTEGPGGERKVQANVRKKDPTVVDGTGVLDAEEVVKVINRRMGAIKGCYERALRRNPTLEGKVTVRFTVAGSGKVTTARATLCELPAEVCDCIVESFMGFRFPPPDGGSATFENPFLFTPAN